MSALHTTSTRHPGGKPAIPPVSPPADPAKAGIISEMASRVATDPSIEPETKRLMIAEAAYYCAERRGFAPGHELEDWLEGEATIGAVLGR